MRLVDLGFACARLIVAPNARTIVAPIMDVDVDLRLIAFSPLFGRLEKAPADDFRARNADQHSSTTCGVAAPAGGGHRTCRISPACRRSGGGRRPYRWEHLKSLILCASTPRHRLSATDARRRHRPPQCKSR